MAPVSWNGSNTLYHRVIKPFVLKHQKDIDKALDKVGQKVDEVAKEGGLKMFANNSFALYSNMELPNFVCTRKMGFNLVNLLIKLLGINLSIIL